MELNQLISKEVARRHQPKKRKTRKEFVSLQNSSCNRCGKAMDEFHLITFYDAKNTPDYRTCFECYDKTDVRSRYFYGRLGNED